MSVIHLHNPSATAKRLNRQKVVCADCGKRSWFIEFFTPWYGWEATCIKCGRQWDDEGWKSLDFARGIRQRNIELAKRQWRNMPPVSDNHYGV